MCTAFVAGNTEFAGIFFVQKLDSAFYSLSVGIISLAAINYAAHTFFCVYGVPPYNSEYWVETNPFSEWLEGKTKASIQKAITRYCNEKTAEGTNKPLCESRTLFDGTGRLVDTVKNKKNLVGFEIVPIRAKGVTTKINKICLQFTKAGEYTLYLMHSSMYEPIRTIKLTKTRDNSAEWFTIDDLYLPYQSEDIDPLICLFVQDQGIKVVKNQAEMTRMYPVNTTGALSSFLFCFYFLIASTSSARTGIFLPNRRAPFSVIK